MSSSKANKALSKPPAEPTMRREPKRTLTDADAVQLVLHALADPRRYQILRTLAARGACPSAMTECAALRGCVEIGQATLSHHMKELRAAGLIVQKRNGRAVSYHVRREVVELLLRQMQQDLLPPPC